MLPDNIDEIYDFIDLMLQYEPKEIVLNHPRYISDEKNAEMQKITAGLYDTEYITVNKMRQDSLFSDEYVKKLNKIIKDIKKKYNPLLIKEYPNFRNESERIDYYNEQKGYSLRPHQRCLNLYKKPILLPDGTIASCLYNKLGNALEQPISEIWNGETAEKTRKYFEENGNFPTCSRCTNFYKEYIEPKDVHSDFLVNFCKEKLFNKLFNNKKC